jgi:two-component system, sensor histidine kinase and response regulator
MAVSKSPSGHTVLVVDDDESNRELARRTLHREHRILLAENGARAFELLDAEPVDLLLLDVILPGMPGFEVCRRVKARARDSFLPVILLSALDEQSDRNAGLAAGADDYLTKPFDRNELRLRVNTFLRLRDQDRAIRSRMAASERVQGFKDDLVALIAHDLRNPLTGIQGNLDLLQHLTAAPEYGPLTARVEKAIASTRELGAILDGLLEVRLLEEERLPLKVEPTPAGDIIREAIGSLEGAAAAKSVSLSVGEAGSAVVGLDRRLVRRALENLLSNAIRHTPPGTTIDVRALESQDGFRFEVADRGEGVPDGLKQELFQKFGASTAESGDRRRGYGLGLYLVRLVAEAHGGNVTIADRPGGGAVFALTLPRVSMTMERKH